MLALALGISHRTAPVEVREKLALNRAQLGEALQALARYVNEGAILSTCNRLEVYTTSPEAASGLAALRQFLSDYFRLPLEELAPYFYALEGEAVARHLFQVAAGIDSMILGEAQILGQVKEAFQMAQAKRVLGKPLSRLFRQALNVGRRARHETNIGRQAVSVSHASVELAKQLLGGLDSRRVLVISSGDTGKLTAKTLVDHGATQLLITNRTYEKAVALAQEVSGQAVPFSSLCQTLGTCDVAISCTASSDFLLGPAEVREAMKGRERRPLYLIDIAVPRDIDPEVRQIGNVFLYDVDDLQAVALANLQEREKERDKVEALVEREGLRFREWWHSLEALPLVIALRGKAEAVRRAELARTLKRLPHLSEEEQQRLEVLTKAIVKKLLHHPTVLLKERGNGADYLNVVRDLFQLEEALETKGRKGRRASPEVPDSRN